MLTDVFLRVVDGGGRGECRLLGVQDFLGEDEAGR